MKSHLLNPTVGLIFTLIFTLQYVWGQYAMRNLRANSARPLVLILWLEGRYQATLGTRRSLGREFLAEEKRKRGKERREEKEEKRGEKRVEVRKRIRETSVFSQ